MCVSLLKSFTAADVDHLVDFLERIRVEIGTRARQDDRISQKASAVNHSPVFDPLPEPTFRTLVYE